MGVQHTAIRSKWPRISRLVFAYVLNIEVDSAARQLANTRRPRRP